MLWLTYLNRVRGTSASAETTLISTGFAQGLQVVARALYAGGARRIAVEDPWHGEYRDMLVSTGLHVVDIAVDEHGMRTDLLDAANADAVVVTPAHQYPTGAVLSAERRVALIDWADRAGATIIEDDYDSEFRYDREPIGAIQGMCRDLVVFAGTASKVLAPGLRLGWLVAPPRLVDAIASVKMSADHGSAAIDQLAFADFLQHGELDRHLRRMRPVYRQRRDRLLASLARRMPAAVPVGASAGLHVLVWLPDGVDESRLVGDAASQWSGRRAGGGADDRPAGVDPGLRRDRRVEDRRRYRATWRPLCRSCRSTTDPGLQLFVGRECRRRDQQVVLEGPSAQRHRPHAGQRQQLTVRSVLGSDHQVFADHAEGQPAADHERSAAHHLLLHDVRATCQCGANPLQRQPDDCSFSWWNYAAPLREASA